MAALAGFALSAVIGIGSGLSGASNAARAKEAEIARIRAQTVEEIRRRTGRFNRDQSEGTAIAGASGFAMGAGSNAAESGGFGRVLKDMQKEFALEVDWLKKSAAAGIDATGQTYKSTVNTIGYNTAGSLVGSFNTLGQTQNWWATPAPTLLQGP